MVSFLEEVPQAATASSVSTSSYRILVCPAVDSLGGSHTDRSRPLSERSASATSESLVEAADRGCVKLFSIELGQSYVSPASTQDKTKLRLSIVQIQTKSVGDSESNIMSRIDTFFTLFMGWLHQKSLACSMTFRMYLIPHRDATLMNVTKVEYYFGRHWAADLYVN